MQALIEHICGLIQNTNAVQIAEAPILTNQTEQQLIDENTSVWSSYFTSYAKQNIASYES